MSRLIYLDNAATTKTAPEVVDAMIPYFTEHYGNPSSVYSFASGNKEVVSRQREIIAQALGAQANEIYFTAGGPRLTIGHLKRLPKRMRRKENISSRQKSSTMQSCIHVSIWKNSVDLRSHI